MQRRGRRPAANPSFFPDVLTRVGIAAFSITFTFVKRITTSAFADVLGSVCRNGRSQWVTTMLLTRLARVATIVCAALLVMAAGPASGKDDDDGSWPVKGKLIGKTKKSGEVKKSEDVSGIACTTDEGFPRSCLVIDDNL